MTDPSLHCLLRAVPQALGRDMSSSPVPAVLTL